MLRNKRFLLLFSMCVLLVAVLALQACASENFPAQPLMVAYASPQPVSYYQVPPPLPGYHRVPPPIYRPVPPPIIYHRVPPPLSPAELREQAKRDQIRWERERRAKARRRRY